MDIDDDLASKSENIANWGFSALIYEISDSDEVTVEVVSVDDSVKVLIDENLVGERGFNGPTLTLSLMRDMPKRPGIYTLNLRVYNIGGGGPNFTGIHYRLNIADNAGKPKYGAVEINWAVPANDGGETNDFQHFFRRV